VGGELLRIVQAEEAAALLVQQAQQGKETAIAQALKEREAALAAVKAPSLPIKSPARRRHDDFESLAKRNRERAVKRVMEEIHALA